TVVVGDPLCAPVQNIPIAPADADPPIDPETELPARFAARTLQASVGTAKPEAVKLMMRAQSRTARGDNAGAREALEQAVATDDTLNTAWLLLSSHYEEAQEFAKSMAIYRKLIARDPNDAIVLNNLAYGIAVREGKPAEALPLAERANLLVPRSAS